jgi:hypothetical protein
MQIKGLIIKYLALINPLDLTLIWFSTPARPMSRMQGIQLGPGKKSFLLLLFNIHVVQYIWRLIEITKH